MTVKTKWLEALRSGKYQQGKGRLRNIEDNTFCCLGVLCDLHSKETGTEWVGNKYLNHGGTIPYEVQEWCDVAPSFLAATIDMNDGEGNTFHEIADYIDKQY